MNTALAAFLRPFLLLLFVVVITRPVAKLLWWIWPDGPAKRLFYDKYAIKDDPMRAFMLLLLAFAVFWIVPYWIVTAIYS